MSTGKVILIIAAVVLLATGISSWLLINNIDRVARNTIEKAGRELLDTEVNLESVEVTILKGKARLSGLEIANPVGYSEAPALVFGAIEVDIDLAASGEDLVVIENILIQDPQVNYEINAEGDSNIDALEASVDAAAPSPGTNTGKLIIERLDFKGGVIRATSALKPERQLKFEFPVIFMSDIGGPDGASPEQVGAEISALVMERITSAATRAGVDSLLDEQKEKLLDKAEEKLEEKLRDLLKRD